MTHSLAMQVERVDGVWIVFAPWLTEPVVAATWAEAWEAAVRARPR